MTTAYTSLLGLALPVTGELSGTWGSVVNDSITSLLDSAIAGTTNVSTDGDVTLTTTTGAANTAREAILLFSGARTALRTVTAPAQSKIYTVINATTGGYAVKLVGAGPTTGVTIANGSSTTVAWNGSDFVEVSSPSSIILPNGTANGVLYLNGSKVVTSGSALTFDGTTFAQTGANGIPIRIQELASVPTSQTAAYIGVSTSAFPGSNNGDLILAPRTSGGNLIKFYTGNGTSAERYSIDSIGVATWSVSGSEQMRLTSTGLGIGTSSPSVKLDVRSGATPTAALLDTTAATAYSGGSFFSGANLIIRSGANATGNGSGIRFASSNNGSLEGMFGWVQNASTYGDFVWQGYNGSYTERMRLDSSGNLGLGVTPSASWVSGSAALQQGVGSIYNNGSLGAYDIAYNSIRTASNSYVYAQTGIQATRMQQRDGAFNFFTAPSGTAGNAITFTQAMSLTASGDLLVGQTSTGSGGLVNSNSAALTLGSNGSCWTMNHSATSAGSLFAQFGYSGTKIGSITVATSSTVAYNTSSDYRLKENIAPMTGALAKVTQLKPCTYTWKIDGSNGQGFIAHELAEVCPEAVTGEKDAVNEDGTINPQGIDTSFLVATLTAALQELDAKFEAYKASHP